MRLRRINQHVKEQNWLAIVIDFFIVVAGILIAFQITNWNEQGQEKEALSSYLTSMAGNIEADLVRLESLRDKRIGAVNRIQSMEWESFGSSYIDRPRLRLASETLSILSNYEYFAADQGAFDTFKSSGLLRNIQGEDVEALIFQYYSLANELASKERDYNEALRSSFRDFSQEGFAGLLYVKYPDQIGDDGQLAALQPEIQEILAHPTAMALYIQAFDKAPELAIRYENLTILGEEIVRIINSGNGSYALTSDDALADFYDIDGDTGYSNILLNGSIITRFYETGYDAASGRGVTVSNGVNDLRLDLPSSEWAVYYFRNRSDAFSERPVKDFSDYSVLRITLRGAVGGEQMQVSMKDSTDLDDGSEAKFDLTLTNEWQTFEIPLETFETADLGAVFAPVNLIFEGGGQSIFVRDIAFAR